MISEGEFDGADDDINDGQENEDYEDMNDGQENEDYEDINDGEENEDYENVIDDQMNVDYVDVNDYQENKGQPENFKRKEFSLQELCLKCVTKNFDTFNTAYSISQDSILRRNLEFLQRVYSSHLIQSVVDREGYFKNKYLDFLINQYLKELDVGILIHCCLESVIKRMTQIGHVFEKISFEIPRRIAEPNIVHFVNRIVSSLENVSILRIPLRCNDETLKIISSSCPKLKELYIDGSVAITNKGLEVLSPNHEVKTKFLLKVLSLKGTKVGVSGISFILKNIPSIEILHHNQLSIILYLMHKEDLQTNALAGIKKYNLTILNLQNIWIHLDDVFSICTKVCPNIKSLSVKIKKKEHLELISQLSELECLNVEYASFRESYRDINNFLKSNGKKLQKLRISCFTLSISVLIQNCPNLEFLALKSLTFQQLTEHNTKMLNCLNVLYLEWLSFGESYAEESVKIILQSNPKLKTISMEHCDFEESEMNTILTKYCENSLLQHLRFSDCDIDESLLETIILTCSTLKTLIIDCCYNISSDEIDHLNDLTKSTKHIVEIFWTDDYDNYDGMDPENSLWSD